MSLVDGESWTRWVHDIRRIEFETAMKYVALAWDSTVLELGSGDGFQLDLLRGRFARVFAIDLERPPVRTPGFVFAGAEALPFPDSTFDLVFSCCVAEHMGERGAAMEEAVRVLRPGGHAVHILPGCFWKIASLLLNPLGYPVRAFEKWRALRRIRLNNSPVDFRLFGPTPPPGIVTVLGRWICPPVHGTYHSHLTELRSYGRAWWRKMLAHPSLVQVAEAPILTYSQFGFLRFRLLPLRVWMAQHGFASSHAFILRKLE